MKTITQLTGTVTESANRPQRGIRVGHHVEISPGQFLAYMLNDSGLMLETGKEQVVIPLEELHALAAAHNPAFATRPPRK